MAKTLRDILESKFKNGDVITINTVALSGEQTSFSGKVLGVGDDYVTLKREGYGEHFIALRHVATVGE